MCFIYYVVQLGHVITENILLETRSVSVFAKCEGIIEGDLE